MTKVVVIIVNSVMVFSEPNNNLMYLHLAYIPLRDFYFKVFSPENFSSKCLTYKEFLVMLFVFDKSSPVKLYFFILILLGMNIF